MNHNPRNDCPAHEWEDSLSEPGTQDCVWCGQVREQPLVAEPTLPPVLVEAQGRRAA